MTDLGGTSEARLPKWMAALLVLALVAASGLLGWVLLHEEASADPKHPTSWDERVAPYVALVEEERGFRFQHPVSVRFLPVDEFETSVRADADELSSEDREEIERWTGFLRALGLIAGDVDLFEASNDASSGNTLAYYSFEDRRITVRGTDITPATKSTLVHELTHALQDQHFGIGDRFEELREASEDDTDSDSTSSVLRAIVEGDAQRIEALYGASLGTKASAALVRSRRELSDEADARTASQDVPEVIMTMMGAPYALGAGLVEAVAVDDGNDGVDELLRRVPSHDDVLLDPFLLLAEEGATGVVEVPETAAGEEEFDSGEFGALGWYLLLAERMPLRDALAAVAGWDGDAYVAYERDDVTCARMAVTHDSTAGSDRMRRALQRWVAASPGSDASLTVDGTRLQLKSCDPGTKAAPGNDASKEALELVSVRNALAVQLLRSSSSEPLARCVAGRLVAEYSVEQLVDPTFGVGDAVVARRVQQLVGGCR